MDYFEVVIDEDYLEDEDYLDDEDCRIINYEDNFEDCLILEVQSNPILYDLKDAEYSNQKKKDSVWVKVAENCNRPVNECKKRWKSLRDRFRSLYNKEINTTSGQGSSKKIDWQFYNALKFLIPTITQAPCSSNYSENSTSSQQTSTVATTPTKKAKRKRDILEDRLLQYLDTPEDEEDEEEVDSDKNFVLSLIEPLKSLSRTKNALARFKIQQLLYELQSET